MKPEHNIHFFTEEISFDLTNKDLISHWINKVVQTEGFEIGSVNFIFCSDDYLLSFNTSYLNHDTFTDIITFDQSEDPRVLEGDIFISIDRVHENARHYNKPFYHELLRVIIHGILHLTGINDKTQEEKASMRLKEDKYLSLQSII